MAAPDTLLSRIGQISQAGGTTHADSSVISANLFKAAQTSDEKNVPSDRNGFFRRAQY